jgi:hypothetical protein
MRSQKSLFGDTIFFAFVTVILLAGFLSNPQGQFSDIRPFYGFRYIYGIHPWPFSEFLPPGANSPIPPAEYPAITGLVIWLLSFVLPASASSIFPYFYLTCIVHGILFLSLSLMLKRRIGTKMTLLMVLSPAIITSINRNWDMWVVIPLVISLFLFGESRYNLSAVFWEFQLPQSFFQ